MAATLREKNAGNAGVNQRASTQLMRVRVIDVGKRETPSVVELVQQEDVEPGKPKGLPEDPWEALTIEGRVIEPPFDMLTLAMLPEHNTVLTPCIEAMEQNIEGFGHRMVCRVKTDDRTDDELKVAIRAEKVMLDNFFAYASIDESFPAMRKKLRKDLETTGNGYLEVIRNAAGRVQGFTHMPSYQIRLAKSEDDPFKVEIPVLELQIDDTVKIMSMPVWKRHRLFVQSRVLQRRNLSYLSGYKMRWFKEFGDPRVYDYETGELVTDDKLADFPEERRANEIVHFKLYSPRSPYGLPRFIGNLLSIYGDRAAGEINYVTIRNNNMPNMAIVISNGQLTEGSVDRVAEYIESQVQDSDNYSKILLIEAESKFEGEEGGQAKVDLKPLLREQHRDELFQNYSRNNQNNVRRCFRLPPIMTGDTETYTRATAETSRRLADEQVFAPEREEFDNWANLRLFPVMGVVHHKYKSNSPNTTDNTELVKILAGAEKTGGMTPRIARLMLEDVLSIELPDFPPDFDPDVPFSMTMAEAVKNLGDASEPGQTVTALKSERVLEMIEKLTGADQVFGSDDSEQVERLLRIQERLEEKWREVADTPHEHDMNGEE